MFSSAERIPLKHGELVVIRDWLPPDKADQYFRVLKQEIAWEQSTIVIAGRQVQIPRLNAWYGDPEAHYRYSGRNFRPQPWTPLLDELRAAVQKSYHQAQPEHPVTFNSALLNLYRDGSDSVAWHADDEPELGPSPQIASLSLGATRRFLLKPKVGGERAALQLEAGTLFFMLGDLQRFWLHAVPKTRRQVEPRINLTFRCVKGRRE